MNAFPRPARIEALAAAALVVLGFLLPFELKEPLLRFGPLSVTNVELALYLALALWIGHVAAAGRRALRWTFVHSAVAAWALVIALSALLAPVERGAALKFALRSAGGCALFFAAAGLTAAPERAARLLAAVVLGGCFAAVAGLAEVWLPGAPAALAAFKTQTTLVGGFVRASGTLQYANTAAMYWEACLLLLVGLAGWRAARAGAGPWRWAALAGAMALAGALVLSGSRAGVGVAGVSLAALLLLGRGSAPIVRAPAAAGLAALCAFAALGLVASPWLALRLRSAPPETWYRAAYAASPLPTTMETGELITVTMTVRNQGLLAWPAEGDEAVRLGYHWLDEAGRVVVFGGRAAWLPEDVPPGGQVTVEALVLAPGRPGRYALQWDMVQENVMWFSAHGDNSFPLPVEVVPAPAAAAAPGPLPLDPRPVVQLRPARPALWRAGWQMWLERPLLGVGPDNFRHLYGRYLGLDDFDDRVHANSVYVETLATLGLAGLLALGGLLFAVGRAAWRGWAGLPGPAARALAAGLLAALGAFLLHGLFDYFFAFTPTYGLFWLLAGTAVGLLRGAARAA